MSSRTGNAKRNIIAGFINKIISILMPFLMRTVIIRELGMNYLGLDNLFVSILQVLNLTELGFNSAVSYCMYKPISEGDTDTICALYAFFKRAYTVVRICILSAGMGIMPFLNSFIKGDIPENINIYILYVIYLANTVISYMLFAYKNIILSASQRLDITNNILTFSKLAMYICQLVLLLAVKNYYIYIMIMPIATIANNMITSTVVDALFPSYKPYGKLSEEMKNEIKFQVRGLFIGRLCLVTRNSLDSIIVSMYLGLTVTAIYNNYYYIMNAVASILTIICNSITPGIGNSIATESEEKNYSDFRKFNFLFLWIVGWCTVCLLCLYQPFMVFWVGSGAMFEMNTVILFSMYFFALMMGNIRAAYSEAAGLWWHNRYRAVGESISNLFLNIVLGKLLGVNGIVLATLIAIVIINFGMSTSILFKFYFLGESKYEYFRDVIYYAAVTAIACSTSMWACSIIKFEYALKQIIWNLGLCIWIPGTVFFLFYRRLPVFKTSVTWVKGVICIKK